MLLPPKPGIMYTHKRVAAAAKFPPERNYHAAEQLGMTDCEEGDGEGDGRGDGADVRALSEMWRCGGEPFGWKFCPISNKVFNILKHHIHHVFFTNNVMQTWSSILSTVALIWHVK